MARSGVVAVVWRRTGLHAGITPHPSPLTPHPSPLTRRVRNYVIYRIACTLQLVFFFFLACLTIYPRTYYCIKDSSSDSIEGSAVDDCSGTEDYEDADSSYPYYYPSATYSFCIPVLGRWSGGGGGGGGGGGLLMN